MTLRGKIYYILRDYDNAENWYNREEALNKIMAEIESYYSWKTNLGSLISWSIIFGLVLAFLIVIT